MATTVATAAVEAKIGSEYVIELQLSVFIWATFLPGPRLRVFVVPVVVFVPIDAVSVRVCNGVVFVAWLVVARLRNEGKKNN